jgi:hypothetical protein
VSNQPNLQGAVETYPDTEYFVGGAGSTNRPPISSYHSITSTFAENFPRVGEWDAAYDNWLNDWTIEVMVWNEWTNTGAYPPAGCTHVTLGGVGYCFIHNGTDYFAFMRDVQVKSGSVDLLAVFQWLVAHGWVKSTDVPTQLEYGVEISGTAGGPVTFPLTGLTFTLN